MGEEGECGKSLYYSFQIFYKSKISRKKYWDFPGGTVVKNPPASAGDAGSSPGLGRSYMLQSN